MSEQTGKIVYRKMGRAMLKRAILASHKRQQEIFNEGKLDTLVQERLLHKRANESIYQVLKKVDLTKVLHNMTSINKSITCHFFANRKAWIHKNQKGEYVYFSRKNQSVYYFDLFDLLSIYLAQPRKEVLTYIESNWLDVDRTEWDILHKERWNNNKVGIDKIKNQSDDTVSIYRLLKKHIDVLSVLNDYAYSKMVSKDWTYHGQPIFYLSADYLINQHFPQMSSSTTNQILNLLCVLGYLEKVPYTSLPRSMADRSYALAKEKKHKNMVSYYVLHDMKDVLGDMENKAAILVEEKVYYHRLTKKAVWTIFGEAFYRRIYVQETAGKLPNHEPVYVKDMDTYYTEEDRLEELFLSEIERKGICKRITLQKASLLPRNRFIMMWEKILSKHGYESVVADKETIRYYGEKCSFIYAKKMKNEMKVTGVNQRDITVQQVKYVVA